MFPTISGLSIHAENQGITSNYYQEEKRIKDDVKRSKIAPKWIPHDPPRAKKNGDSAGYRYLMIHHSESDYISKVSPILHRKISAHRDIQSPQVLLDALLASGDKEDIRVDIETWIEIHFSSWLRMKTPSLAAVLEAAFALRLPNLDRVFVSILSKSTEDVHGEVANIAARRIRYYPIASPLNAELWPNLRDWIETWEQQDSTRTNAEAAMQSVLFVGGIHAVSWLGDRIANGTSDIAWATLDSPLEWALEARRLNETPDLQVTRPLYKIINDRLQIEYANREKLPISELHNDLIARAIWTLGALADSSDVRSVARIIQRAFTSAHGFDSTAAVYAGKALIARHNTSAWRALTEEFSQTQEIFARYLTSIHRTRTTRA